MNSLTREQVRRLDRLATEHYGVPGIVLMENAGRGVVEVMTSLDIDGPVVICLGKGNNAGDGLVIARHLDLLQHHVTLVTCSDPAQLAGDAGVNFRIAKSCGFEFVELDADTDLGVHLGSRFEEAGWIVDAILGTGAGGAPKAPYDRLIRLANESTARRLAIDIPSGLDCDTGEASNPTFKADHTCTFVAAKPGLLASAAAACVGELHIIDIGAPRQLVESLLAENLETRSS